jgi:hypothetical protein
MPKPENEGVLYSAAGVPVGSFAMGRGYRHRSLSKADREYCARFVETVSKNRKKEREDDMVKDSEKKFFTSQIFVGGTVRRCETKNGSTWCLVDTQAPGSDYLFCGPAKDDKALHDRLAKYQDGDHILIWGWLRITSKQVADKVYSTRSAVVITEIRSEDPKHEQARAKAAQNFSGASDDDIPF